MKPRARAASSEQPRGRFGAPEGGTGFRFFPEGGNGFRFFHLRITIAPMRLVRSGVFSTSETNLQQLFGPRLFPLISLSYGQEITKCMHCNRHGMIAFPVSFDHTLNTLE